MNPDAEDKLASLRREATLPVVMADEDGVIVHVNSRFEEAFGWTRKQIIGQPLTTIIPPRLRDAHNLGFSRFLLTGVPTLLDRPLGLWVMTSDGRELRAEHLISAERVEGHWIFGATVRPLDRPGDIEGEPPDV